MCRVTYTSLFTDGAVAAQLFSVPFPLKLALTYFLTQVDGPLLLHKLLTHHCSKILAYQGCDRIIPDMSSTLTQSSELPGRKAPGMSVCVPSVHKTHHRKGASWFLSSHRTMQHTTSSSLYTKQSFIENKHQCATLDTDSPLSDINRKCVLCSKDYITMFRFVHFHVDSHSFEWCSSKLTLHLVVLSKTKIWNENICEELKAIPKVSCLQWEAEFRSFTIKTLLNHLKMAFPFQQYFHSFQKCSAENKLNFFSSDVSI